MAATNSNIIYANWKHRDSNNRNMNLRYSHEYPMISGILHKEAQSGKHNNEEGRWCLPNHTNSSVNAFKDNVGSFIGTRHSYQYRSNPHISFADNFDSSTGSCDNESNTDTYEKTSCNPVRLAVTRNSNRNKRVGESASGNHSSNNSGSHQQIQKWTSELTAAASGLPRKWCDFVFRRNEDNRVYRSESFRFIQKTNSLALLTPASGGVHRYKSKRTPHHGISVNDDYIDPVDHVLNASLHHHHHHHHHHDPSDVKTAAWSASSASGDTSSGSRKSGIISEAASTSTHCSGETGSEIEPPYHEIRENYNAPYYYSDTIKEPTYVTPCENEGGQSASGTNSISDDTVSPSPTFPEPVTVTVINVSAEEVGDKREFSSSSTRSHGLRKHTKLNRRSAYLRGTNRKLMARKRYETAFLPSSTPHSSSQSTPDIDSLVLAIESSCQLGHGYVSKTDISQQKTAKNFRSCFQEATDQASGPQRENKFSERCGGGDQSKGQDGGVEQRIICISHPPNNTSTLETLEQKGEQREELPSSSSSPHPPICFPETTVISSSNFLPQTSVSYHRTSKLESTDVSSNASLQTNPSMSLCQQGQSHLFQHHYYPHHVHQNLNLNLHASRTSGLCTTTNSSPLATHKKPVMPLSEPLPQKRYVTKSISSSGHNTTSSSSSSEPGETRRLGHNLKDNSVSSLESIDSMKSEDLPASINRQPVTFYNSHHQSSHYYPQKLLSPISDKSPLEPAGVLTSSHQTAIDDGNQQEKHDGSKWPNNIGLLNHSELTNVPWEMPKLRRKLAKLADSGISLDFSGSGSKETECGASSQPHYAGGVGTRASLDLGFGASGTQHGITQGQSSYNKREMGATTLQLSFDDGLTRDEYYEDPHYTLHEGHTSESAYGLSRHGFLTASKIPGSAIMEDVTVQVHVSQQQEKPSFASIKPDRCRMKLDFSSTGFGLFQNPANVIDPTIELERQDWFHGAITRCEAESILRATKEGSFLVRNCESTTYNRYSLSLKSFRGCIHIRIEPNSLGTFSLGDQEFPSVPHLVLHFMSHRLPIKGAEHVRLMYPVITQLL
ncbi:unnamed protein product [Orchesella dallaii]|uniref:SH2 domain-containing protein n=1 Tax=Orchesella dallaii TaxID=48710 RepID=A0ABP1PXT1_9HEXA